MKVYIATDAEGMSGIYKLGQVMPSNKEYQWARTMMANDVNAAAEGAFRAGADRVIVNDGHNAGNNILIDQLLPGVDLISGQLRPLGMAQGADLGCDVALLVGYHRRKGAKGVASHSYAYGSMVEMHINGKIASEHDLIGYVIGSFGIPVIFLSGDDLVTEDAKKSIPGLYTVTTKIAISNNAALCFHPAKNAKAIADTVEQAILHYKAAGIQPMHIDAPVTIDVRYTAEIQAERACSAMNASRLDESTVRYSGDDYMTAYRAFMVGTSLAGQFRDDADLYI